MEFLIILIALLLISLLSLINAFHILSLSQKNIKNVRKKLDDSISYYFDLVPRQLLEEGKLESELSKKFFARKKNLNPQNFIDEICLQKSEFNSDRLNVQANIIAENIHTVNSEIIKLENKLNKKVYIFLSKFLGISVPVHISE